VINKDGQMTISLAWKIPKAIW